MNQAGRFSCAAAVLQLACTERQPTDPATIAMLRPTLSAATSLTVPSSLKAVAASPRSIDVDWHDNSTNETGFEVRRSTDGPSGSFPVLATTAANVTIYGDTGLTPGGQYCYKIRAISVGRKTTSYSALTDAVCAATPLPPPPPPSLPQAPTDVLADAAGSHAVAIWWIDRANNEDGFRLERSADGGAIWVTAAMIAANVSLTNLTSTTDQAIASDMEVCYRVSAFNQVGVSSPSNVACATTIAGPTELVIDRSGLLTWTDNSALEDGYEVRMIMGEGWYGNEIVDTLPANTTNFQTQACGGWCQGFSVVPVKDGAYSDAAEVILPPAIPSNVTATAVSAGEVDLSWVDAPSGAELSGRWFGIERCAGNTSACGNADFVEIASIDALTFRDTQVLGGTTHTYRVRAYNNNEMSPPSNTATATTPQ